MLEQLINTLENETKGLKIKFIELNKEYAKRNFEKESKICKWSTTEWCEYFGLTPILNKYYWGGEIITFPDNFYNTKDSVVMDRMMNKSRKIRNLGIEGFVEKAEKDANIYYTTSIKNLHQELLKRVNWI